MEGICSKALFRALISLFIAGSCIGTAAPMMRGFGARLSGLGRMFNRRGQTALHMAQFSTARRAAFPKKFKPKKLVTPPKKHTALLSQKSTSGLFGGWLARAKSFGLRALQALRIVKKELPYSGKVDCQLPDGVTDKKLISYIEKKKLRGEKLSPTEAHMLVNRGLLNDRRLAGFRGGDLDAELQSLQTKIIRKEYELVKNEYVPFYHAQSSEKYFPTVIDTFLYELRTGILVNEFLFLHTPIDKNRQGNSEEQKEHEAALKRTYPTFFFNACLRGNTSSTSGSFPYIFKNNVNPGHYGWQRSSILEDIFSAHCFDECYVQFKDELQRLHKEYKQLSKYGTLLQIAIPYEHVGEMVAPVRPGGGKAKVSVKCGLIPWYRATDNMKKIARALRDPDNYPKAIYYGFTSDNQEYAAYMTYDEYGLMNPKCGAKMYTYMIPKDEKAYQEWQTKWEDLKTRIKAYIQDNYPVPGT